MVVLAVETSSLRGSVALLEGASCRRELVLTEGLVHGREVIARIDEILRHEGLRPRDLEALAVGLGPGSFTGTRVGVTAAKTLALALEVPLAGVSSLAVLAAGAVRGEAGPLDGVRRLLPLVDAGRGGFYAAAFDAPPAGADDPPRRRSPDRLAGPEDIAPWADGLSAAFGSGADRFLATCRSGDRPRRGPAAWDTPRASVLGWLAWRDLEAESFDLEALHRLEPLYLRAPEAERARGRRARGDAGGDPGGRPRAPGEER